MGNGLEDDILGYCSAEEYIRGYVEGVGFTCYDEKTYKALCDVKVWQCRGINKQCGGAGFTLRRSQPLGTHPDYNKSNLETWIKDCSPLEKILLREKKAGRYHLRRRG